jgi:hypothetical protein
VIQLLSFGGFGIWWLIDLVLIATNRYRDAKGNLLSDANPRMRRGCVTSLGVWLTIALCFGFAAVPLDRVIFGTTESGPLFRAASFLAAGLGGACFLYMLTPDATIWRPIKRRLEIWEDRQQTKWGIRFLGRRIPLAVLTMMAVIASLAMIGVVMLGESSPESVSTATATSTHTSTPVSSSTPEPDQAGSAPSTTTPIPSTSTPVPPTITPIPTATTVDPYFVTRQQFSDEWPFTVDEGRLLCIPVGGGLHHALFLAGGTFYALNGTARSAAESEGYIDVFEIWRDDPDAEGLKINMTPMLRLAERACDE